MRAMARLTRVAACGALAVGGLLTVGALGHALGVAEGDVRHTISTSLQINDQRKTVDGVTTEGSSTTRTIDITSSDGSSSSNVDTNEWSPDDGGSRHDHSDNTYVKPDGSSVHVVTDDTSDSMGGSHTETTTTTDADGNVTITNKWAARDGKGNVTDHGENVQHDKVAPPTPHPARTAAPTAAPSQAASSAAQTQPAKTAGPSRRATPGPTGTGSSTGGPAYWTGTITYAFSGSASGPDVDNILDSGTYNDTATYTVVLGRDYPTSTSTSWSAVAGTAMGSVDDDLYQSAQGTTQRSTVKGSGWANVPRRTCTLSYSAGGSAYSLKCDPVTFDGIDYVLYEAGGGGVEESQTVTWAPDFLVLDSLPLPSNPTTLSGSRKVDVHVDTAGSVALPVQADVTWNLTAGNGNAPTTPPDVIGKITLDGPPLAVSIMQPSQRAVVGLPLLAGQKPTIKVTGNTIGPVKVSLFKSTGELVSTTTSSDKSFDLLAQTLGSGGTYSVTIEGGPGKTGELSVAATSK
jgi:hypothetical protein